MKPLTSTLGTPRASMVLKATCGVVMALFYGWYLFVETDYGWLTLGLGLGWITQTWENLTTLLDTPLAQVPLGAAVFAFVLVLSLFRPR
jgi:hypothetical protein